MTALVRAELLKLTSVRRTWIGVGIAVLFTVLLMIVGLIFFGRSIGDEQPATEITDRILLITGGLAAAPIVVGVLGIQALGAEFRTHSIIPSAISVPQRSNYVVSKVIGVAIFATAVALALTVLSVAIGMIGLQVKDYPLGFDDHDMARITVGMVLLPLLYGLYGLALALLVKSTSTAIAILLVQSTLGETALGAFLPDWISRYLPFTAANHLIEPDPPLNPFEGLAIMGGWIFLLMVIGYLLFERRDLA